MIRPSLAPLLGGRTGGTDVLTSLRPSGLGKDFRETLAQKSRIESFFSGKREKSIQRTMTTMIARRLLPSLYLGFLFITIKEAFVLKTSTNFQRRLPFYAMKRKQPTTTMDAVTDQAKVQQVLGQSARRKGTRELDLIQ
jgi:hypothetical protein